MKPATNFGAIQDTVRGKMTIFYNPFVHAILFVRISSNKRDKRF